jgi:hypothetical protein
MQTFCQLVKASFTGEFEGCMASSRKDRQGEILDYDAAKAQFAEWSRAIQQGTGGRSLGNVRESHNGQVVGKLTDITFDDARRMIWVKGQVIDKETREKLEAGLYSGLSIGGDYLARRPGPAGLVYVPRLSEVSLVDYPANPDATLTIIKRDGSTVKQPCRGSEQLIAALLLKQLAAIRRGEEPDQTELLFLRRLATRKTVAGHTSHLLSTADLKEHEAARDFDYRDRTQVNTEPAAIGEGQVGLTHHGGERIPPNLKYALTDFVNKYLLRITGR